MSQAELEKALGIKLQGDTPALLQVPTHYYWLPNYLPTYRSPPHLLFGPLSWMMQVISRFCACPETSSSVVSPVSTGPLPTPVDVQATTCASGPVVKQQQQAGLSATTKAKSPPSSSTTTTRAKQPVDEVVVDDYDFDIDSNADALYMATSSTIKRHGAGDSVEPTTMTTATGMTSRATATTGPSSSLPPLGSTKGRSG